MLFLRYNPSYTEGTLKPILLNPSRAPLRLFSFGSFFGFFSGITVPNTPFTCFAVSSFTLTPITLNCYIC